MSQLASTSMEVEQNEIFCESDSMRPSQNAPGTTKQKRSKIYEYFEYNDDKRKYKCKTCRTWIKETTGTGSMVNHLKTHKIKYAEFMAKAHSSNLLKHVEIIEKTRKRPEFNTADFRNKLINFIVMSDQPFSLVEEESFQELISYATQANAEADLPSRKVVRELIREKFDEEMKNIVELLCANSSKVSFTLDGWSSKSQISFQGVTAHWINNDWVLQTAVLDMRALEGCHSGENLCAAFSDFLDEFKLWDKLHALTTDNAGNMDTLFQNLDTACEEKSLHFNSKNQRVRCLAHIINLACKNALKNMDDTKPLEMDDSEESNEPSVNLPIISKIRKAVHAVKYSQPRLRVFKNQCTVARMDSVMLVLDVKTRWNSTLSMLERAYKFKEPLDMTIKTFKVLQHLMMTDEEWEKVRKIIELLEPFREATVLISAEISPTLADTVVIYNALFDHLEKYLTGMKTRTSYRLRNSVEYEHPEWLRISAEAAWTKLTEYYPTADGLAFKVATVLDPRYKLSWYGVAKWKSEWISASKKAVRDEWKRHYQNPIDIVMEERETTVETEKEPAKGILAHINSQLESIHSSRIDDEFHKYLSQGTVSPSYLQKLVDSKPERNPVLEWWKIHEHEFPTLGKMAKDYLAITATSVPVERAFSAATDILSPRRQRLGSETIKECLCLKSWLKKISWRPLIESKALGEFEH